MHFCYLEHGYFNRYLTDEGHQAALQSAEQIAQGIRKIWRFNKDILERFEEAYKFSIERGTKYGWTTTTFDILAGEPDEFNEMMKARIEQEKIKKAIELNKANER